MGLINRETFLAHEERKTKLLPAPGGNGSRLRIRALTHKEFGDCKDGCLIRSGKKLTFDQSQFETNLVIAGLIDDEGRPILKAEDAAAVAGKDAGFISDLADQIVILSGMKADAEFFRSQAEEQPGAKV